MWILNRIMRRFPRWQIIHRKPGNGGNQRSKTQVSLIVVAGCALSPENSCPTDG